MLCEICGEALGEHTCKMCGRLVCRDHYVAEKERCTICTSMACSLCDANLSITHCSICGRLICLDCGIQVSTIHYVCKECYSRLGSSQSILKAIKRRGRKRMPPIRVFAEKIRSKLDGGTG